MTEQEQIFAYKELRKNGQVFVVDNYADADRIIEALEKQIPKKPKKESMCSGNAFDSWDKYNCPDCNNFLHSGARSLVSKYTMPKYCGRCGQKLDWSEENDRAD